jgi:hypothetical protein
MTFLYCERTGFISKQINGQNYDFTDLKMRDSEHSGSKHFSNSMCSQFLHPIADCPTNPHSKHISFSSLHGLLHLYSDKKGWWEFLQVRCKRDGLYCVYKLPKVSRWMPGLSLPPSPARQLACTHTKAMWVGLNLSLNEQSGQDSWARQCSYVLAFSYNDRVKPCFKSCRQFHHKLQKYTKCLW